MNQISLINYMFFWVFYNIYPSYSMESERNITSATSYIKQIKKSAYKIVDKEYLKKQIQSNIETLNKQKSRKTELNEEDVQRVTVAQSLDKILKCKNSFEDIYKQSNHLKQYIKKTQAPNTEEKDKEKVISDASKLYKLIDDLQPKLSKNIFQLLSIDTLKTISKYQGGSMSKQREPLLGEIKTIEEAYKKLNNQCTEHLQLSCNIKQQLQDSSCEDTMLFSIISKSCAKITESQLADIDADENMPSVSLEEIRDTSSKYESSEQSEEEDEKTVLFTTDLTQTAFHQDKHKISHHKATQLISSVPNNLQEDTQKPLEESQKKSKKYIGKINKIHDTVKEYETQINGYKNYYNDHVTKYNDNWTKNTIQALEKLVQEVNALTEKLQKYQKKVKQYQTQTKEQEKHTNIQALNIIDDKNIKYINQIQKEANDLLKELKEKRKKQKQAKKEIQDKEIQDKEMQDKEIQDKKVTTRRYNKSSEGAHDDNLDQTKSKKQKQAKKEMQKKAQECVEQIGKIYSETTYLQFNQIAECIKVLNSRIPISNEQIQEKIDQLQEEIMPVLEKNVDKAQKLQNELEQSQKKLEEYSAEKKDSDTVLSEEFRAFRVPHIEEVQESACKTHKELLEKLEHQKEEQAKNKLNKYAHKIESAYKELQSLQEQMNEACTLIKKHKNITDIDKNIDKNMESIREMHTNINTIINTATEKYEKSQQYKNHSKELRHIMKTIEKNMQQIEELCEELKAQYKSAKQYYKDAKASQEQETYMTGQTKRNIDPLQKKKQDKVTKRHNKSSEDEHDDNLDQTRSKKHKAKEKLDKKNEDSAELISSTNKKIKEEKKYPETPRVKDKKDKNESTSLLKTLLSPMLNQYKEYINIEYDEFSSSIIMTSVQKHAELSLSDQSILSYDQIDDEKIMQVFNSYTKDQILSFCTTLCNVIETLHKSLACKENDALNKIVNEMSNILYKKM